MTFRRGEIRSQVKATIQEQIKQEVKNQITSYIPVPLEEQIADTKKRLNDARIALANSEARAQNAAVDINSEYEPLAPVLTDSGNKSAFYPADLGSLFSYDGEYQALLFQLR